jgi:hypothetical protein
VINNNSSSIPGTVPSPSITNGSLLSIDADGEQDWFIFDLLEPSIISVSATPVGLTYDDNTEGQFGCNSGSSTNSLTIANLSLELREDDGITIINSATANPAGSNEVISTSLPAGTYYARVFESSTFSESQLYSLNITVGAIDCDLNGVSDATQIAGNPDLDCNDNAVIDSCDIAEGTSLDVNLNGVPDECESTTTTEVIPITVITNQIGTFSGAVANVHNSDNSYVLVNPTLNGNSTRWQTDHWFECNSPVADIIQLDVKTEVGENVNTIKTTKLYIYNWDLLTWTQLTSYGQPAADTIKIFTNIANPDAYVKDNNGKIRVRIRTQEDFANQPTGYQGRIDHVEVKVTY